MIVEANPPITKLSPHNPQPEDIFCQILFDCNIPNLGHFLLVDQLINLPKIRKSQLLVAYKILSNILLDSSYYLQCYNQSDRPNKKNLNYLSIKLFTITIHPPCSLNPKEFIRKMILNTKKISRYHAPCYLTDLAQKLTSLANQSSFLDHIENRDDIIVFWSLFTHQFLKEKLHERLNELKSKMLQKL